MDSGAGSARDASLPGSSNDDEIAALRAIVEGTAASTGDEFFRSLVRHLAVAIDVRYAFVAEFRGKTRVRTLAYLRDGQIIDNVEWDVRGTPCEDVVGGRLCHHPVNTWRLFPDDKPLERMKIESYLGVPLLDADKRVLGHLAVFDRKPMPEEARRLFIFRIFAARAAAELNRLRAEAMLRESEERYRDLYEEAPIAYIYEDLESRFVRANSAACKLLGIAPDQVTQTIGKTLLAPTPETRRRIEAALDAMRIHGNEFAGVELELRRKDDGRPIWVQWYSKPEPDGRHTRTMLIDITERVLMEQEKARLQQQNQYLQEEIKQSHNFDEIVGRSPQIAAVLENVRRVAPTDASVLVFGETGTGKELIARAIHSASTRAGKPLIKVNCAALPTGLVESELFGHERGAFSGAIARRVGKFEVAHGGTIFLDEIGEVPLEVQAKLLRVLQEREFDRIGGNTPIRADVRIIAATNRDLRRAVKEGTFREDLYYRLNVFPIQLPSLRERGDDIALLVQFLIGKFRARLGKGIEGVAPETMQRLMAYPWPGNVRELENVLERAAILARGPLIEIEAELLPAVAAPTKPSPAEPIVSLSAAERDHILAALQQSNWRIDGPKGAARILDMHPNTLRSRLKKLGITRPVHEAS
jgi:PAS domain S-box-containing protein